MWTVFKKILKTFSNIFYAFKKKKWWNRFWLFNYFLWIKLLFLFTSTICCIYYDDKRMKFQWWRISWRWNESEQDNSCYYDLNSQCMIDWESLICWTWKKSFKKFSSSSSWECIWNCFLFFAAFMILSLQLCQFFIFCQESWIMRRYYICHLFKIFTFNMSSTMIENNF